LARRTTALSTMRSRTLWSMISPVSRPLLPAGRQA
jgi:hypothetical protein